MWQLSNVLRRAADGGIPPVMDSRAATEGGPYLGFVGAALRGGPALVRHIRSATIFCTSSYVAVSARNPSRATVLRLVLCRSQISIDGVLAISRKPAPPISKASALGILTTKRRNPAGSGRRGPSHRESDSLRKWRSTSRSRSQRRFLNRRWSLCLV
jgi:hypothetical protein